MNVKPCRARLCFLLWLLPLFNGASAQSPGHSHIIFESVELYIGACENTNITSLSAGENITTAGKWSGVWMTLNTQTARPYANAFRDGWNFDAIMFTQIPHRTK